MIDKRASTSENESDNVTNDVTSQTFNNMLPETPNALIDSKNQ